MPSKTLIDGYVNALQETQKYWKRVLSHAGEKGRASEFVIRDVLEEILPQKYSIGTGFVATTRGSSDLILSRQQDIVIFDRFQNPARVSRDNFGIFPVEAVYATIEVKESATKQELRRFFKASYELRDIASDKQYAEFERHNKRVRVTSRSSNVMPRRFLLAMGGPPNFSDRFSSVRQEFDDPISVHGALQLSPPRFVRYSHTRGLTTAKGDPAAFFEFIRYLLNAVMSISVGPLYPHKYLEVEELDDEL